jgi:hypothetical protein
MTQSPICSPHIYHFRIASVPRHIQLSTSCFLPPPSRSSACAFHETSDRTISLDTYRFDTQRATRLDQDTAPVYSYVILDSKAEGNEIECRDNDNAENEGL